MPGSPQIIDIHTHSKASDGEYPAADLGERAAASGLTVWGLCDHDTLAGLSMGADAAQRLGLRFVPGIELSTFLDGLEIHLLGHFIDPVHATLREFEDFLADRRRERMAKIIEQLAKLGVVITAEQIVSHSGGKTIGRPHIGKAIVETGAVATVKEAFDRFIGEGRPAYVQRFRLEAAEAVRLVRGAGGTVTVAHPGLSRLERGELKRLRAAGVVGLEVAHPEQNPSMREKYARLAAELDFVPTAGSDYHGASVSPGRQLGAVSMGAEAFARLESLRP
jgi:predicted metal-dependent phosphoesterase TrpH